MRLGKMKKFGPKNKTPGTLVGPRGGLYHIVNGARVSGPAPISARGARSNTPQQGPARQPHADLDRLYADAVPAMAHLKAHTERIAKLVGGEPRVPSTLKGRPRTEEKIRADFQGDASRIVDLARSSIVVESMSQLRRALAAVRETYPVVRVKDRFKTPVNEYRDMLLNVRAPNGHVMEIQLHLKTVIEAKKQGHHLYEDARTIEAKVKGPPPRDFTAEERHRVAQLELSMRQLYREAYLSARQPALQKMRKGGLPDDPKRYFEMPPGTLMVPISKLKTIRRRESGVQNAEQHMRRAYVGEGQRRKPISVRREPDGSFTVVDGNSTTAIARKNKWRALPVLPDNGGGH
jgi:hypothetical protein